jgi:flagellin-specific chaperone FliS
MRCGPNPAQIEKEDTTYRLAITRYLEQEIMAAGRVDLVIRTFEVAIAACNQGNSPKALKAVSVLEQSLNADAFPELVATLSRIYRYCRDLILKGAFREARGYLDVLRDAWLEVKAGKDAGSLRLANEPAFPAPHNQS